MRGLLRLILIVVIVVAVAAFFVGYRWRSGQGERVLERPVATSGSQPGIDTSRARETGAALGEKVAVGANAAARVLSDAGMTAKIKSKIALDDTLDSSHVSVNTDAKVVTLSGSVTSAAQRARALQLAGETDGVRSVVDHLHLEY